MNLSKLNRAQLDRIKWNEKYKLKKNWQFFQKTNQPDGWPIGPVFTPVHALYAPKSEQRLVRTSRVWISVVRAWALSFGTKLLQTDKSVWNPNRLFGFQTQIYKFTYMCLKSKHFVLFELYVFGFQTQICVWNPNNLFGFQTLLSLRSNLVPNDKAQARTTEIRTQLVRTSLCSDFGAVWKPNFGFQTLTVRTIHFYFAWCLKSRYAFIRISDIYCAVNVRNSIIGRLTFLPFPDSPLLFGTKLLRTDTNLCLKSQHI